MKKYFVMMALTLALGAVVLSAQQAGAKRGQTYADLAKLPDWSGAFLNWAMATGVRNSQQELTVTPPFIKAEDLARFKATQEEQLRKNAIGGVDNQLVREARERAAAAGRGGSAGFNGAMSLGPTGYLEFVFTPGRVTIFTSGITGNSVRRIYTDGTYADPTLVTAQGISTGHWEGETLVVETVALNPKTVILGIGPAGDGFKIHERIFMKEKPKKGFHSDFHCPYRECDGGVLEFDTTLEAPQVLSGLYKMPPQYFAHAPYRHELLVDYTGEPTARDRSIDPKTGRQTFDLTPPGDIPPPPAK